jgi:adenine-specific DNA-methyltransferase
MPVLDWIGKASVVNHHRIVPYHLLHCDKDQSFGNADAGNLLVQGDNLSALKALLPYYAGKIKCIYIDPPYNTGNEGWVYNDNLSSPAIRAWLGSVVGKEAEDLSRHDKWLCMMYPRLRILKEFLAEDGVIFVSCDGNELSRLLLILEEIFRPGNLSVIPVVNNLKGRNDQLNVAQCHEYLVMFGKPGFVAGGVPLSEKQLKSFNKVDAAGERYQPRDLRKRGGADTRELRAGLYFPVYRSKTGKLSLKNQSPDDIAIYPVKSDGVEGAWRWGPGKVQANLDILEASYVQKADKWNISYRVYLNPELAPKPAGFEEDEDEDDDDDYNDEGEPIERSTKPKSFWWGPEFSTDRASKHLRRILGAKLFDYPKPVDLIRRIIHMSGDKDSLILDSFAGSGTTAEAVLAANRDDGGNRRFILVEMESSITETVTVPRLRHSVQQVSGSGYRFCKLGDTLFDSDGNVGTEVTFSDLAAHIFFCDTGSPIPRRADGASPLIGVFQNRAIYLLFSPHSMGFPATKSVNVLTATVMASLPKPYPEFSGTGVVYGEGCTVPDDRLTTAGITFRQIPYQIEGL